MVLTDLPPSPMVSRGASMDFQSGAACSLAIFAHNPHAIAAMSQLLGNLSAKRKYVLLCHAGDRSDQEIKDLTKGAVGFGPDMVVTAELEDSLRGRELGEIRTLISAQCVESGSAADAVMHTASPGEGTAVARAQVSAGEV